MSINNSQVLTILLLKTGKEADCLYFSVYIFLLKHLVLEIDFSVNWLIFEQNFLDIDRYLLLLPPPPSKKMLIVIHFCLLLPGRAKVKYK